MDDAAIYLQLSKERGIRFDDKHLGRPKEVTEDNQEQLKRLKARRREQYLQRIRNPSCQSGAGRDAFYKDGNYIPDMPVYRFLLPLGKGQDDGIKKSRRKPF